MNKFVSCLAVLGVFVIGTAQAQGISRGVGIGASGGVNAPLGPSSFSEKSDADWSWGFWVKNVICDKLAIGFSYDNLYFPRSDIRLQPEMVNAFYQFSANSNANVHMGAGLVLVGPGDTHNRNSLGMTIGLENYWFANEHLSLGVSADYLYVNAPRNVTITNDMHVGVVSFKMGFWPWTVKKAPAETKVPGSGIATASAVKTEAEPVASIVPQAEAMSAAEAEAPIAAKIESGLGEAAMPQAEAVAAAAEDAPVAAAVEPSVSQAEAVTAAEVAPIAAPVEPLAAAVAVPIAAAVEPNPAEAAPLAQDSGIAEEQVPPADKQEIDFNPKDAQAQYLLGLRYYTGDRVAKNYKEAYKWFSLSAADKGGAAAVAARNAVARLLSPKELKEAKKAANKLTPRKKRARASR